MRALVVEDFDPLRRAIVEAIQQLGWAVEATGQGREGFWFATGTTFDIIVLDLMLPGMPGLELLQKYRQQGGESPVLILSAKDQVEDRVAGLDAGADDYLIKPFAIEELQARVRTLVRRQGPSRSPMLQVGDLEIDPRLRRVRSAEREVPLTPREYAVLEYLARHPDEVVTRSDIWENVYCFHDEGQSNVVDVYISSLRRKLEAQGEPRLIHTRRGYGYMLSLREA